MELNWDQLSSIQISAVKEIANIGLGHSAISLSEMTGKTFHLSVPDVDAMPVQRVTTLLGGAEELTVGVYMHFEGDVQGSLALVFPWASAQSLWRLLFGTAPESYDAVEMLEASAMIEIGNILNSHFLNAISSMTDLELHSTPPVVGIDAAYPIIQTIVVEAEIQDAIALTVETSIYNDEEGISGYFLFIPSRTGLQKVLDLLCGAEAA